MTGKLKTDEEYRKELTPEQYEVTRQKATEPAFTGKYWDNHEEGVYRCVCCGNLLFESGAKYDSGTGWPSFWAPVAPENVKTETDRSYGMRRTELVCSNCEAHLGHV
ncbi:MAG: peptide-methionine (R)-S-oxide reductase MsrB, partial [Bryobacteraceae bacterium]